MTLEDLLNNWIEKQQILAEVAVAFNQANKKRREIEAKYVIEGKSKPKAEALFIVDHSDDWDLYQDLKEQLIIAESNEKQASKIYYQTRDDKNKGDAIDSQISKIVQDNN